MRHRRHWPTHPHDLGKADRRQSPQRRQEHGPNHCRGEGPVQPQCVFAMGCPALRSRSKSGSLRSNWWERRHRQPKAIWPARQRQLTWTSCRIRHERQRLLEVLMSTAPTPGRERAKVMSLDAVGRLDRYERRAEARRKKSLVGLSQLARLPIFK
jgi:hypothetical protein